METATPADVAAIGRLLGRPPRALAGVAARCPHGGPAVLAQRPYDVDGTPFPTTYWLACRALALAIARLEGDGGCGALERELAADAALAADRAAAEARVAAVRADLDDGGPRADGGASLATGIGGIAAGGGLKCLHAHAAVALADPPYALGRLALERAGAVYPARCCACA